MTGATPPIFPKRGSKWNQLGPLARKFYADHHSMGWAELLARLGAAKTRLVEDISDRSDEELYGRPWYNQWTKGRMIQFNTASPYANARSRIRRWLREHC